MKTSPSIVRSHQILLQVVAIVYILCLAVIPFIVPLTAIHYVFIMAIIITLVLCITGWAYATHYFKQKYSGDRIMITEVPQDVTYSIDVIYPRQPKTDHYLVKISDVQKPFENDDPKIVVVPFTLNLVVGDIFVCPSNDSESVEEFEEADPPRQIYNHCTMVIAANPECPRDSIYNTTPSKLELF